MGGDNFSPSEIFPIYVDHAANVSNCKPSRASKGNMKGLKDVIHDQSFVNPKVSPLTSRGLPPSSSTGVDSSSQALRDFTTPPTVTR